MESMTVLLAKLASLAQLNDSELVISTTKEGPMQMKISVGESEYYADLLTTETLSSALLHLSMLSGAKRMNVETQNETTT